MLRILGENMNTSLRAMG